MYNIQAQEGAGEYGPNVMGDNSSHRGWETRTIAQTCGWTGVVDITTALVASVPRQEE